MTQPTHYWRAEVTVTGVYAATPADLELANTAIRGVIRHAPHRNELRLTWRFANSSPDGFKAVEQVTDTWRGALDRLAHTGDTPVVEDVHVHRVVQL